MLCVPPIGFGRLDYNKKPTAVSSHPRLRQKLIDMAVAKRLLSNRGALVIIPNGRRLAQTPEHRTTAFKSLRGGRHATFLLSLCLKLESCLQTSNALSSYKNAQINTKGKI